MTCCGERSGIFRTSGLLLTAHFQWLMPRNTFSSELSPCMTPSAGCLVLSSFRSADWAWLPEARSTRQTNLANLVYSTAPSTPHFGPYKVPKKESNTYKESIPIVNDVWDWSRLAGMPAIVLLIPVRRSYLHISLTEAFSRVHSPLLPPSTTGLDSSRRCIRASLQSLRAVSVIKPNNTGRSRTFTRYSSKEEPIMSS